MHRATFFEAIRPSFGGSLSKDQVDGMLALLDAGRDLPLHHMAHVLANVRRETGGIMAPIKETVQPHHKNRNPTDAEVIRRLNVAWRTGKLPWVKAPYWQDGWFGRGQIQITHKRNYDLFGVTKDQALEPATSARIAVEGMRDGRFAGRKLADFVFPGALDNPPANNPRRIVNGQDGSDAEVARSHRQFAAALERAGWVAGQPLTSKPVDVKGLAKREHQTPAQVNKPSNAEKPAHASIWRQIFAWFTGARQ